MRDSLLLDTNVLLDYADPARSGHELALSLITAAIKAEAHLLVAPSSLKDFYYCFYLNEKRNLRSLGCEPSEAQCLQIADMAMALIDTVTRFATVISNTANDPRMALKLAAAHHDFEDNLLAAAAMHVPGCILVTADKQLLLNAPVPSMSPAAALARFE